MWALHALLHCFRQATTTTKKSSIFAKTFAKGRDPSKSPSDSHPWIEIPASRVSLLKSNMQLDVCCVWKILRYALCYAAYTGILKKSNKKYPEHFHLLP